MIRLGRPSEEIVTAFTQIDPDGNKLLCNLAGDLFTILVNGPDPGMRIHRKLGTLTIQENTLLYTRTVNPAFNKFRECWGVNYPILIELVKRDGLVRFWSTDGLIYQLYASEVLAKGPLTTIRKGGGERQIFVPLSEWRLVSVNKETGRIE